MNLNTRCFFFILRDVVQRRKMRSIKGGMEKSGGKEIRATTQVVTGLCSGTR